MSSQSTPGVASTQAGADGRVSPDDGRITPIGVDVGTRQLVTVASAGADPADAVSVDGAKARDLYTGFTTATHQRAARDHHAETLGDLVWRYWRRFRRRFEQAADVVLEYAQRWPAPVVVLEDLPLEAEPLVTCRHGNVRESVWLPAAVQRVVADRVVDAGVPITYVAPDGTSVECHECGEKGDLRPHTLVCETPGCPVDEVDRDRSAAVSIAKRLQR